MKIEQYFRVFLERHNYLQLPQIGRFEVVGENPAAINGQHEKWINFSADKNQKPDTMLVNFISGNIKKESYVIESDLNCFISNMKELLIQGFEVEISGIGYLHFELEDILKFSVRNIYKKPAQKSWKRMPVAMSASFWL